jgi:hypothetical protein
MESWYLDLFNHSGQFPSVARCNHFHRGPRLNDPYYRFGSTKQMSERGAERSDRIGQQRVKHENFQSKFG